MLPLAAQSLDTYVGTVSDTLTLNLETMVTHLDASKGISDSVATDLASLATTEAIVIEACEGAPAAIASVFQGLPDVWVANDAILAVIYNAVLTGEESEIDVRIQTLVRLAEAGSIPIHPDLLRGLLELEPGDLTDSSGEKKLSDKLRIAGWTSSGDPLYRRGIHANDIDQQSIGDCYFVAALAAVASKDTDLIRSAISGPNPDGTYTIRLYEEQDGALVPRFITVNDEFPDLEKWDNETKTWVSGGGVLGRGDGELWPRLMEKAYAHMLGDGDLDLGYYRLNKGGNGAIGLEVITGSPGRTETDDVTLDELQTMLDEGIPMPASQRHKPGSGFMGIGRDTGNYEVGDDTIHTRHQYWVEEIRTDGTIVVRNPWSYDGYEIEMTIDEFNEAFREVDFIETSELPPTSPTPPTTTTTTTTVPTPTTTPTPTPTSSSGSYSGAPTPALPMPTPAPVPAVSSSGAPTPGGFR